MTYLKQDKIPLSNNVGIKYSSHTCRVPWMNRSHKFGILKFTNSTTVVIYNFYNSSNLLSFNNMHKQCLFVCLIFCDFMPSMMVFKYIF